MPLFYQHNINEGSKLGIWKIEEAEGFFLKKVTLHRNISHPHKRLQHLAGRYLLQKLFPDFPYELILIADTRKPFLSNDAYHFSISHCGDFAAAMVSKSNRVGVDIELVKPIIERIQYKFLSGPEMQLLDDTKPVPMPGGNIIEHNKLLTLSWSAKEAIYKWYGYGGLDFKDHIRLCAAIDFSITGAIRSSYAFSRKEEVFITVISRWFSDLVLSYVLTEV